MVKSKTCLGYVMASLVSGCLMFSYQTHAEEVVPKTVKEISSEDKTENLKRKNLLNKLTFFKKLVFQSPKIKTIDEGDDKIAKDLLEKIRSYYVKANNQFEQGNLDETEKLINQGFSEIPKVFNMVKNKKKKRLKTKQLYQEISKRVDSFCLAFADVVSEKGVEVEKILDLSVIDVLVNEAKAHASENRYNDAYNIMKDVSNQLEVALSKARDKETLTYTLEFLTPEDEYIYELKRNKSYSQVANNIIEHYPPERARRLPLVKRLYQKNDESIAQANELFKSGEIEQAIDKVEKGTKYLVQALRISGLAL